MIKLVCSITIASIIGILIGFGLGITTYDDNYDNLELYLKNTDYIKFISFTNTSIDKGDNKILSRENKDSLKREKSDATIPVSYREVIYSKSDKYRIEPLLVSAIIKVESNWDFKAVSRKGAMGLMQLMPSTAKEMAVKNPFNPEENIEGGIKYLRYLLDKYNGDLSLALAAYNAGPQKIKQFRGIPPIKETKQYVKRVLLLYSSKKDSSF